MLGLGKPPGLATAEHAQLPARKKAQIFDLDSHVRLLPVYGEGGTLEICPLQAHVVRSPIGIVDGSHRRRSHCPLIPHLHGSIIRGCLSLGDVSSLC